jgi:hypothetical protein
MLRLQDQSRVWAVGYAVFVVVTYSCAIVVLRTGSWSRDRKSPAIGGDGAVVHAERVSLRRRAKWVALSFVPSSLMLAVTSYLSTDIAAVPLLWVVPLSLYLLTFVIAFGSRAPAVSAFVNRFLPLLILPLALTMVGQGRQSGVAVSLHFSCSRRPAPSPQRVFPRSSSTSVVDGLLFAWRSGHAWRAVQHAGRPVAAQQRSSIR